ncbi:hypothetical protein O166_14435 [Pseudogulbenkiania ferrooxidans EGD-HP2]|uniref:Uncharacterized protein n=1 Tax=Pseudogulbenkiania ferrooxidans EGD-HP2 TaxID=1388764 RepID=A0ABP2XHN8_9NEIS|nr:hypothetical protein O166_14435 [Pseudogulbenkiania ferrooxidans EGD-HP2]
MVMSMALRSVWRLFSAGRVPSDDVEYPAHMARAAAMDFSSSPWSQLMLTPGKLAALSGLTFLFLISQLVRIK